jgi:hypothetical protein
MRPEQALVETLGPAYTAHAVAYRIRVFAPGKQVHQHLSGNPMFDRAPVEIAKPFLAV